ncbi:Amino acid permease OS=Rhodanobacter lindaniclasticus OX=75310 GN=B1991_17410 PE=4 SV=1 [Rhodanobacter lindaniclasticus]
MPHVDAGEPVEGSGTGEVTLKRALTARRLIMLGIGAVIGAGIFVLTGTAAAQFAGPALVISFLIAGFACALAGLCYAEFAAMLPVSGSAYSYSYATLGEVVAWFVGWNLVLEYLFAASTVAVGWSGYFNEMLRMISGWIGVDISLPAALASAPLTFDATGHHIIATGTLINLPAVAIVAAISWLCYRGITQSATVNAVIVAIKVIVILLFLAVTFHYLNPDLWHPFIPENEGGAKYGWSGVIRAATLVFFAYIGFDAVSTAAGEAKNPSATCRSASSARWRSAPCCTSPCPLH